MKKQCLGSALTALALMAGVAAGQDTTVTFDNGTEGWSISGRDQIIPWDGNPGSNMWGELIDVFGADIRNDTHRDFIGDLTQRGPFTLSIDIKVNSITFWGSEVPRDLVVELRSFTPDGPYPWVSVFYPLGTLTSERGGWIRYGVHIADPNSAALPAGWGGTGDEDPETFEPRLPPDRTFASVLASVDEIAFTTFVPGWFFGFTNFDIQIDNVHIGAGLGRLCGACVADYNNDGGVDGQDVEAFFLDWQDSAECADANEDGGIDGADVETFFRAWEDGGCG